MDHLRRRRHSLRVGASCLDSVGFF
jgi:hypothetical protein